MEVNKLLIVGLLLCTTFLSAQTFFSKPIKGKVSSADGDVAATHVLNISSGKATITDIDGFFSITANLNDTLVFSAVQYKKKEIIVTAEVAVQKIINVFLEAAVTALDEVIVTPYNLSGDIVKDLQVIKTKPVVTAQTLGLPNAYVRTISKAERELFAATANPVMSFDPLINAITGRTKMLKKRLARNKLYARTERVRAFYPDSLYQNNLKIAKDKIDDLLYFCEVDSTFQAVVDTHDKLKIWEFIRKKSLVFKKNTDLVD